MSLDGQEVYLLNDKNELWFAKEGQEPVKIAEDVYGYCYNPRQDKIFFIKRSGYVQGGTLYFSKDGGTPSVCDGIRDVFQVYNAGANIICQTNMNLRGDKYHLYYSHDGVVYNKMAEVSLYMK